MMAHGVTVAQQTLTLLVGVRIPVSQPCVSNSMVEYLVANEAVAGSSPVSRTISV